MGTIRLFARKLEKARTRYSVYDRELLAIQEPRVFQAFCGKELLLQTAHKPFIYAFQKKADKADPSQTRQLDYISQFPKIY